MIGFGAHLVEPRRTRPGDEPAHCPGDGARRRPPRLPERARGRRRGEAAADPVLEFARAGARRLASALAEAHSAMVTTPSRTSLPPASTLLGSGDWVPPARATPARSGVFIRMVELPGLRLAAMLDEWWASAAVDGWSAVGRRLRVAQPTGDARGGWTMAGRVRRLTPWRWAPVVIELWPRYARWTMITMTPQASVLTTRRYFRTGHAAIDRLTRMLAETRAAR